LQGNELESESPGFGARVGFPVFVETDLIGGNVVVVEFLVCGPSDRQASAATPTVT